MARVWICLAALLGSSGVAVGAYCAHGLESQLQGSGLQAEQVSKKLDNCLTAVRYQMIHAVALLAIGIGCLSGRSLLLNLAGGLFCLGVVGFSGGIYLDVFLDRLIHPAIIPSGGVGLIIGWLVVFLAGLRGISPA